MGTQVLLDVARAPRRQRYLQVSTDEVYGSLGPTGAFTETTPLQPTRPYSASKAAADLVALAYHHTYGLDVVITRCSNNYGPYQFPEKLIPLFVTNAMDGQAAARLRRRQERARLDPRRRPLPRRCCWRWRGARPARSTTSAAAASAPTATSSRRILGAAGQAGAPDQLRRPIARATTGATPSTPARSRRSWAAQPRPAFEEGWPRRWLVPRQPRLVGSHQGRRVSLLLRAHVRRPHRAAGALA